MVRDFSSVKTSDFDYELPLDRIAQAPVEPRDSSRLLVLDRRSGEIQHTIFREIGRFLREGDLLVINETRVIPARLLGRKLPGGGRIELLLLKKKDPLHWEALAGGKGLLPGRRLQIDGGPSAEIVADLGGALRLVRFEQPIEAHLPQAGHTPLPPYIHRPLEDPERYQTVYARVPGSAAAPTAGLHFTPLLLENLQAQGIAVTRVLLHIGLDTFAPLTEEEPQQHKMHREWYQITPEAASAIESARARGGRVIAVGTTSVRALESAARLAPPGKIIVPHQGATDLFILPGFEFRVVDALITNFHLPRSTLIMLVSAFAGRETILNAYQVAIREGYRFYSFGDAMLIL